MILAILQARVSSTRLPGKVLKPLLGQPMILRQIERLKRARAIDRLIVATSVGPEDDALADLCRQNGLECFRGSLDDVLDRFYQAAKGVQATHVMRLTGDCPLVDPEILDALIRLHLVEGNDYSNNTLEPCFPDGLDAEIMTLPCLEMTWQEAVLPSQREHVTSFIYQNPQRFKLGVLKGSRDFSGLRWTVDEPEDFVFVSRIYEALYPRNPAFGFQAILDYLEEDPDLQALNSHFQRNEGYLKSLNMDIVSESSKQNSKEKTVATRYQASEAMLARALKTIPLGTQTFSKSKTQYPFGVSPFFVKRGQGSRVWDVDGNEYIDFSNSLAAITLGYNDPDVTSAVRAQLEDGVSFTLATELEINVAEKIVEMVPCAEMVRFGKNGSDATAGAVRLARAYTGRDHVLVCGYHGWQDWYIGATARNMGVPQSTRDLTHTFPFNDLEALSTLLKQYVGQVAAVILEPLGVTEPMGGYLEGVKELCQQHGAVLIFDETITGFRCANGGAQEYYGVTPDLATFGKGLANGYPVSAVAGKAEIMKLMEEIFFSFTFGGEALSLAASLATMTKLQQLPVVETLRSRGQRVMAGVQALIEKHGIAHFAATAGYPASNHLLITDVAPYNAFEIKTLFLQEVFARGILTLGAHNMSYAHNDTNVDRLLGVYDEVFPILKDAVENRALESYLRCEPLVPLFKIR